MGGEEDQEASLANCRMLGDVMYDAGGHRHGYHEPRSS